MDSALNLNLINSVSREHRQIHSLIANNAMHILKLSFFFINRSLAMNQYDDKQDLKLTLAAATFERLLAPCSVAVLQKDGFLI